MDGVMFGRHGHEDEVTGTAPGDLELVRSFISLHDHPVSRRTSAPPSTETIAGWLRARALIDPEPKPTELEWARQVLDDLRLEATGGGTHGTRERLNEAARRGGVSICFGCDSDEPIHASATGVTGAVGRLLAIAFLAELNGTWERLRACANPECLSVFWDRSKNGSGRWCSMAACGNQAKVRAYRERERASRG
jgi:hypothetical protein